MVIPALVRRLLMHLLRPPISPMPSPDREDRLVLPLLTATLLGVVVAGTALFVIDALELIELLGGRQP